ncbi:hypothetical protein [Streptomyces kebangsaanensis]|uniref:hypothetical protein n=1 Tax=Streptomyces kebangsaanensis TaxID=864058 RepID=UPI000A636935|nr:hypothetical protein [Streptomyces kebangsaanensis]
MRTAARNGRHTTRPGCCRRSSGAPLGVAGTMAEMLLHMPGLSVDEARDLARRLLPAAA